MPSIDDRLDEIVAEHDRIGSPLRRYLRRPGPAPELVRARLVSLGLPHEVVAWFAAQDGVDQDAWHRDTGGPIIELVWGCEPFGLEVALSHRRDALEDVIQRPTLRGPWIPVCGAQGIEYLAVALDGGSCWSTRPQGSRTAGGRSRGWARCSRRCSPDCDSGSTGGTSAPGRYKPRAGPTRSSTPGRRSPQNR